MKYLILFLILNFVVLTALSLLFVWKILDKRKRDFSIKNYAELLTILQVIITTEVEQYENQIFIDREGITNQNFEMFLNDLTYKVTDHITPQFMKAINIYIKEENVYQLIVRSIEAYLRSKINNANPQKYPINEVLDRMEENFGDANDEDEEES